MHDEKNQLSLKRPPSRSKKILYLKKIERWQKKKNPRQIFVDKIFSMFVKINKTKYVRPQKKIFFLRPLLLQLPEALLKTKKKKFEIIFEEENFLVIFAI